MLDNLIYNYIRQELSKRSLYALKELNLFIASLEEIGVINKEEQMEYLHYISTVKVA